MIFKGEAPSLESTAHPFHYLDPLKIRRSKENRLYDNHYNIIFDFYLNLGGTVLGYKPKNLGKAIKGTLDKEYSFLIREQSLEQLLSQYFALPQNTTLLVLRSLESLEEVIQQVPSLQRLYPNPKDKISLLHQINFNTKTIRTLPKDGFLFGHCLFNGLPIFLLSIPKHIASSFSFMHSYLSKIEYQILSYTLKKGFQDRLFSKNQELQKKYQNELSFQEDGSFTFIKDFVVEPKLLLKQCILIHPQQTSLYIPITQNTEQSLNYLIKTVKNLF